MTTATLSMIMPRCLKHEEFFAGHCQKCANEEVIKQLMFRQPIANVFDQAISSRDEQIRNEYIQAQLGNHQVRCGYYGGLVHTGQLKSSVDTSDDKPVESPKIEEVPQTIHTIQTVSKKLKMWVE